MSSVSFVCVCERERVVCWCVIVLVLHLINGSLVHVLYVCLCGYISVCVCVLEPFCFALHTDESTLHFRSLSE